ncbi:MAG: DUF2480 family protein [Saprospiraceae bacterium]|nr:DUF2480 family protein [Saprospiraceae bacterium]
MNSDETILVNKVAQSALITIKPEDFLPKETIKPFDIKQFLFRELLLKELDFRAAMKALDWNEYRDCILAVHCSNDAIIPTWAYMLITQHAHSHVKRILFGTEEQVLIQLLHETISTLNFGEFKDKKIVIKGCSERFVPASAYLELTNQLLPYASSIMYGEPCSTVPIYKKKN